MANTFKLISSYTATGSVANISFSSIPSTYTDLQLFLSARTVGTADNYENVKLQFNGSGGTAYSDRLIYSANASTALSAANSSQANTFFQYSNSAGSTANTFSNTVIYIPNYASSNYKSVSVDTVSENNDTFAIRALAAELWSNTAAITSITLTPNVAANFGIYTTAYLYGIKSS